MAAFLAGSNNFQKKRAARLSTSDEYEESDEEKQLEIFHVEKIVAHIKLEKGSVYKQARGLLHTFHVAAMEKSKFDHCFKVRWRHFGEKDDTWEPIENFNSAMGKKIRKYCKRKAIPLPDGFEQWLIPMAEEEEASSGSDGSDAATDQKRRSSSRDPKGHSRSPQPSTSRPKNEVKKKEEEKKEGKEWLKKRAQLLQDDLTPSGSPSPQKPSSAEERKMLNDLFECSDDESSKKMTKRQNEKINDLFESSDDEVNMGKKERKEEQLKAQVKKPSTPKETPKQEEEKKEQSNDTEKKKKKEKNKKRKLSDAVNESETFIVPDDDDDNKKNGDNEKQRKKKERADLVKKAADYGKKLEEEAKRKKEKKQAKLEKEKQSPTLSSATSNKVHTPPEKKSDFMTAMTSSDELKRVNKSRERGADETPKREKRVDEDKKKGTNEKRKEVKKEKEIETEDRKKEAKPVFNSANFHIPNSMPDFSCTSEDEEERFADAKRFERARNRLDIINVRVDDFIDITDERERQRFVKWEEEENKWRKSMYEQKRWTRNRMISDMPFSYREEKTETDDRYVRTLRRCSSTERLPHSFRRLSSLHSVASLPSEADSLAAALVELEVGDQAKRHDELRARVAERKRREQEELKGAPIVTDAPTIDLNEKTELFIRETIEMANELMPGEATVEIIRELSQNAIDAFLSYSYTSLIQVFNTIHSSACINATVLRLMNIFHPLVNLETMETGCSNSCDGGEHRKCRMIMTLLLCLSEPHRMGDEPDCLMPPNALYDSIGVSAPCQIRAMIRGGCTFDFYYDEVGKNAAHLMMEKCPLSEIVVVMERGLDVNSAIMPVTECDLKSELYDKPWKIVKEEHEKMAFVSQLHSNRLTARSVAWTKSVPAVAGFNLRPLTLVHTITPHSYMHRLAAVTLCNAERKGFDRDDSVLLAVHAANVRRGKGLRKVARKTKLKRPKTLVPYFLIDQATDDANFAVPETYQCTRAKLSIYNLDRNTHETVELERLGDNGATTVYKVPKKQAQYLLTGRRYTECLLKIDSPPEHSVILAQYFIVPFRNAMGKFAD